MFYILYLGYVRLSTAFPVEDKPGFTEWPLDRRGLTPLTEIQFSGLGGNSLGTTAKAHFGVPDPQCRGMLPFGDCWTMDRVTVDVSCIFLDHSALSAILTWLKKMIEARKPAANNCRLPCLFYTEALSGAAERIASSVLNDLLLIGATEGPRRYQTIWVWHL